MGKMGNAYNILVENSEEKRPLGKRRSCIDGRINTETDAVEV
jgi:hypothetical protein